MVVSNFFFVSNTLKFDDVVGVIFNDEMWWKIMSEMSSNALNVNNGGTKRERVSNPNNHGKSNKVRSKSRGRMEC